MTELLTEIERFEGICFLATNRPQDLDEAMHRRLTGVFELPAPNHRQRKQIWTKLTAPAAVPLEEDVDLDAIALKYELTGGYIRNAVLAALLRAVGRLASAPCISQADLHEGCKEQMRGALQLVDVDLGNRQMPARALESLVLPEELREHLGTIIGLEKARICIYLCICACAYAYMLACASIWARSSASRRRAYTHTHIHTYIHT